MNKIITLPTLVALIAEKAGITTAEAERFINAFTSLTGETLANAEQIKIKGIGTFRLDDMGTSPIAFMPDPDLAAKVNEPFSFFEAVELNDGVTEEMLSSSAQEHEEPEDITASTEPPTPPTDKATAVEEPKNDTDTTNAPDELTDTNPSTPPADETTVDEAPTNETDKADETDDNDDTDVISSPNEEESSFFPTYWMAWAAAIGLIIGFAVGFFAHDPIMDKFFPIETVSDETEDVESTEDAATSDETVITPSDSNAIATEPVDTVTLPKVQPVDTPNTTVDQQEVYDTITQSCFLTTLAYKHYGKKDYWIYIYLENQDKLRHPDKIRPGTRVRIPAKEKYATASTEEENIRAARNKAAEIYRKYK